MMMNDDELEGQEMDGLQSYARKGMAQELAKKLGLLGDVPGAQTDADAGTMDGSGDGTGQPDAQGDGSSINGGDQGGGAGDIPPELLMQILQSLGK